MLPIILSGGPHDDTIAYMLGLTAILFLIGLLMQRECMNGYKSTRIDRLEIALGLAIVPLFGIFVLVIIAQIASMLTG